MEDIILKPLDWLSAIGWTLIGIAFVKALIFPHGVSFSLRRWVKENLIDVIRGLLLTLITLKLGLIVIDLLQTYLGVNFEGIEKGIESAGLDPIQLALVIAIVFQYWLYKRRNKK